MTELDKMKRAHQYMTKLADGIDPLTDRELPEDTALNQVRLSRCFFYVADILRQVIENGGEVNRKRSGGGGAFYATPEQLAAIAESPEPLTITQLCARISESVPGDGKLGYLAVTDWLTRKGFLRTELVGGKKRRRSTREGESVGIVEELRTGTYGEYYSIVYRPEGQRFVMDNLPEILAEKAGLAE